MKTNGVMIGDYVTFKDCQNEEYPIPVKIIAIGWEGDENGCLVEIDDEIGKNNGYDILEIDELVGLPITPKLLNSTIDDCPAQLADGKDEWQILTLHGGNENDPAYDVIIADGGNGVYETTLINHDTGKRFDGVIRYVHELQHALQLCDIDKEIML